MTALNNILRDERQRRGWTYKDVADKINLPDSRTVGRWERGTTSPGPYYRRELSRIFEKSIEELGLLKAPASTYASPIIANSEVFNKMPMAFSSFVGRTQELLTIITFLKNPDVRLLTLFGTNGIGKTRLGIEAATQVRDHFTSGVCFVPLNELRDPASLLPAIAAVLDIQDSIHLTHQVKTFLREKQVLLLLDTFEHITNAAPLIEELLRDCPHIKVLVTSRHILHLEIEYVFAVPPLSLPNLESLPAVEELSRYAAIALFLQRAQTHVPTFKITANNAHTIAELCIHLNGLPLAIELAAARIKFLSPHDLLTRLLQNQHMLKSGPSTIPERHRTLYATIQFSYDSLAEQEQWLMRHLAIFVGNISLETIEAFFHSSLQTPSTIMEIITSLLDKSLLQRIERDDGEQCFFLLETIRSFAIDYLQQNGEMEQLQQRYAHYYLALVEQATPYLKNPLQTVWLTKLEQEIENLRAALQWLITQQETDQALRFCEPFGTFCGLRGYWHEGQQWLKAVMLLPQTQHQNLRGKVLRQAGYLAYCLRELTDARTLLEQSVVCLRQVGDLQNLASALSSLGWLLYRQNEIDVASQMLKECVDIAYDSEDFWALANALESLGRLMYFQGKLNDAHTLLEKSIFIARTHLDEESLARILITQVKLEITQGNRDQAVHLAQESSLLAKKLGTRPLIALTLNTLGEVALFQGTYTEARQHFEKCIEIADELGMGDVLATAFSNLAGLHMKQGGYTEAESLLERAILIQEEQLGFEHPDTVAVLSNLASLYIKQGRYTKAEPLLKRAQEQLGFEHPDTAVVLSNLASLYMKQGHYTKAKLLLDETLLIQEKRLGIEHPDTAIVLSNLASLYMEQGNYSDAEPLYLRILRMREQYLGPQHLDTAIALSNLANIYIEQGTYSEAEPFLMRALLIQQKQLGPKHPATAVVLSNLATLHMKQGHYSEAETLYQRVLQIREQQLGPEHPDTGVVLSNLATLHMKQGHYSEAETLYQRVLQIREQQLGPEHPDTGVVLSNLATLHMKQGNYSEAEPFLRRSLHILEHTLGPKHQSVSIILSNLALVLREKQSYDEAEMFYRRALTIDQSIYGISHTVVAMDFSNLGTLLYQMKRYAEAEFFFQRALEIDRSVLGIDHPIVGVRLKNLSFTLSALHRQDEARHLLQEAERVLGKQIDNSSPFIPEQEES